jgi:putative membrane protein
MEHQENSMQTLRRYILQWLITSLAIFAAFSLVPGITFSGNGYEIGIIAMIYSVINLLIRPVLTLITCPMIILTLGMFTVIINGVLLLITADLAKFFGIDFHIETFFTALIGAVVISLTTFVLNLLSGENNVKVHITSK